MSWFLWGIKCSVSRKIIPKYLRIGKWRKNVFANVIPAPVHYIVYMSRALLSVRPIKWKLVQNFKVSFQRNIFCLLQEQEHTLCFGCYSSHYFISVSWISFSCTRFNDLPLLLRLCLEIFLWWQHKNSTLTKVTSTSVNTSFQIFAMLFSFFFMITLCHLPFFN